ncbi:hypothetical protein BH10PSE9_BH10PSE9_12180 [soil metagenome]
MSWLADAAVWVALIATSGLVISHRRRLKRLGRELAEFRSALAAVDAALITADGAMRALVEEGGHVASTLADRIEQARALIEQPARNAA